MSERTLDALLVHVYSQPNHEGDIKLDIRGHMQVLAASMLYRSGRARNIYIGGGHIFGKDRPSAAHIYQRELKKRGVPENRIITRSDSIETGQEIDGFIEEARERRWESLGSVATSTHIPRISFIHKIKQIENMDILSAEKILAKNPRLKKFLRRFRLSYREFIFWHREKIVSLLYQVALKRHGSIESANDVSTHPMVQKIKDYLDR